MGANFGKRGGALRASAVPRAPAAMAAPVRAAPGAVISHAAIPTFGIPFVTIGLVLFLGVVFALQDRSGNGGALSTGTLIADGAISRELLLGAGQWWRLFTAPLLHGSFMHLLSNMIVLGLVGYFLEPLIGSRWFAALFVAGALGGDAGSVSMNAQSLPSIGASGAIMGVLGAAFVCGFHDKAGPNAQRMQYWAARLALPALIPLATSGQHAVDYGAHMGGALAGLAMGIVFQMLWPENEDRPGYANIAGGIAVAGLAAAGLSFLLATQAAGATINTVNADSGAIPEDQLPARAGDLSPEQAASLLARYPHDPRAHFFRGVVFLSGQMDFADAETQLRAALPGEDPEAAPVSEDFTRTVKVVLAITLAFEGKPDAAKAMGAPLCGYAAGDAELHKLYENMQRQNICS
jgi:rhomboid protease GluP